MTTELDKVLREYAATEGALTLAAGQWGQAQDTGRIKAMRRDGVTSDWFESASRLSGQTSTTGTTLIGSAGITGITPNGGSSGGAATLANMLTGFRDSVILKTPYNNTINTIQPNGNYTPLAIKSYASGTANILSLYASTGTISTWVDYQGNLTLSRTDTASVALTVGNGSNASTSAHATMMLSVGGGSGGDPYIRFNVNGATDWTVGADNSDSDKFKFSASSSLGTSDILTITTAGLATLSGDLTVTRSNAAATNTLTVSNTSTTSGSGALVYIAAAAGGGNAQIKMDAASTIWSIGVDKFDSGKFKISQSGSLGSNDLLTFDTGGIATFIGDVIRSVSNPGITNSITVSNPNNSNTASHAQLLVSVGGGSAGDPSIRFNVSGVTDWTVGADNSDSDNFHISRSTTLGTSDALYIDSSLNLTMPGGNLSVSRSNVGGDARTTISNTDNTNGASHALLSLLVQGSSGGDPFIRFTVSSVTDWSAGVDNSSSDNFKICRASSLGTNDALTIDSTLSAYIGGSLSVDGGSGAYFRLPRGTSNPSSPSIGMMYQNTADGHVYWYSGSGWFVLI